MWEEFDVSDFGKPLEVGTRVHWDHNANCLYYVDVPLSEVYKYEPSTKKITKAKVGTEPLGFAFPTDKPNTFIASLGRKFVFFEWDGEKRRVRNVETIAEVENTNWADKFNRINGGKVDPAGRLWAGTMGPTDSRGQTIPKKGALYSITQGKLRRHERNIGISNGLAWNVNIGKMYYVDTLFRGIYQYDYNIETGDIANKEVVFDFDKNNIKKGLPDGLTIDTDGNLWLALIDGGAILHIETKTGTLIKTIEMKTIPRITAVCWGDPLLDTLYVNTAKRLDGNNICLDLSGCTFRVKGLAERGLPENVYRM